MDAVLRNRSAFRGFTLIELLIVIAIILILISIALPNFLEAQLRARIVRANAGMKALATALDSYHADSNRLPATFGPFSPSLLKRLIPLTTPIPYLKELPRDPFQPLEKPYWDASTYVNASDPRENWDTFYLYNRGDGDVGSTHGGGNAESRAAWSLTSAGPDKTILFPYFYYSARFSDNPQRFMYSPTNGSKSDGEMFLRGGHFLTH
jgi:prepilin-type N-terminal cleavage/methylation domain-containing protein